MQTPPPHPPDKEGPFLPRMNDRDTLTRFGEVLSERVRLVKPSGIRRFFDIIIIKKTSKQTEIAALATLLAYLRKME